MSYQPLPPGRCDGFDAEVSEYFAAVHRTGNFDPIPSPHLPLLESLVNCTFHKHLTLEEAKTAAWTDANHEIPEMLGTFMAVDPEEGEETSHQRSTEGLPMVTMKPPTMEAGSESPSVP